LDIVLAPIEHEDIATIREWEPYPAKFAELDYALREGGWLDEFLPNPNAKIFSAKHQNELIGFSLLCDDTEGTEFRIALKPDKIGKGFGKKIAVATIREAFERMGKNSLYLIVRLSNIVAKELYEKLGFIAKNEITKEIQEKTVRFLRMEIDKGSLWAVNPHH
jgi:diamine N-acetyltransferase